MNQAQMNDKSVVNHQAGPRPITKQGSDEKSARTARDVFLAVIAVGFVLLIIFFAAAGTKTLDITSLEGKGQGPNSQEHVASGPR